MLSSDVDERSQKALDKGTPSAWELADKYDEERDSIDSAAEYLSNASDSISDAIDSIEELL